MIQKRTSTLIATIIAALFITFAAASMPADSEEPVTGRIIGTVKNFTNDTIVPQQEVLLSVYREGREENKLNTTTDSTGSFVFSDLEISPSVSYMASATYQEVEYFSQPIRFLPDNPKQTIELKVYSTSDDDSKIQVTVHHLVVQPADKLVAVTEVVSLKNDGNTSFLTQLSENGATQNLPSKFGLKIELPRGYRDLKYGQGFMEHGVSVEDNAILYSHGTQPGETSVTFSYNLPANGEVDLSRPLFFKTEKMIVFVAGSQPLLTSNTLQTQDKLETQGKTYMRYEGNNLSKGQMVDMRLTLPSPSRSNPAWSVGIVSLGIVLALALPTVLVIFIVTNRRKGAESKLDDDKSPAVTSTDDVDLEELKNGYLELISKLDEMYQAGEISEGAYKTIREEEKAKLGKLIDKMG